MWLPLVLSLVLALPPITGLDTSFAPPPRLFPPSSLDECLHQAANQPARWRQVYGGACLSAFLTKARNSPEPASAAGLGVVVATGARYRELKDIQAGVTAVYTTHKRSGGGVQGGGDGANSSGGGRFGEGVSGLAEDEEDDRGDDGSGRRTTTTTKKKKKEKRKSGGQAWLSVFRRAVMRTRRQHSLSINSALVSLADMLMTNDYNRERARQRAFRQQLLGIGR